VKLKAAAAAIHAKVQQSKNATQKIKLILNVIAPDNYTKKFKELREYLFGDKKSENEFFDEGTEESYNRDLHALKDEDIDSDLLETIVQNIFRKAQLEKEYCIFYGTLCEDIIKLETGLRGLEIKVRNTSKSLFR
jgi:methionine synthase I (cobalamin-dependent)